MKVAVKILEKSKIVDQADITRVSREIHILKKLRHPNLIQLYEVALILKKKIRQMFSLSLSNAIDNRDTK